MDVAVRRSAKQRSQASRLRWLCRRWYLFRPSPPRRMPGEQASRLRWLCRRWYFLAHEAITTAERFAGETPALFAKQSAFRRLPGCAAFTLPLRKLPSPASVVQAVVILARVAPTANAWKAGVLACVSEDLDCRHEEYHRRAFRRRDACSPGIRHGGDSGQNYQRLHNRRRRGHLLSMLAPRGRLWQNYPCLHNRRRRDACSPGIRRGGDCGRNYYRLHNHAGETPGRENAAQPGNRRRRFALQRAQASRLRNARRW